MRDFFRRDTLQREVVFATTQPALPAVAGDEFLQNFTHIANFENQMHGAQLGARLFRQRGHWMLSGEIRLFAMANFQTLKIVNQSSILPNPEILNINGTPDDFINFFGTGGDVNRTLSYGRATQFVFGGEVRGEASYELTRDVNLRVGFVFLDLGQGIGRGDTLGLNNQAVQMAGVTFGFTVNR
jgi:hypothetical protein